MGEQGVSVPSDVRLKIAQLAHLAWLQDLQRACAGNVVHKRFGVNTDAPQSCPWWLFAEGDTKRIRELWDATKAISWVEVKIAQMGKTYQDKF